MRRRLAYGFCGLLVGCVVSSCLTVLALRSRQRSEALLYTNAAVREIEKNNVEKAIAILYQSVGKDPHSSWTYSALADGYIKLGQYEQAIGVYRMALTAIPKKDPCRATFPGRIEELERRRANPHS